MVHNHAPVIELLEQGPTMEDQLAAVTKNRGEGSNDGDEVEVVTDVTTSNKGGRLSESNLEPELLPIKDPISNRISPFKAPTIVGKEVNAISLNRATVDSAELFEIKIKEIDELLKYSKSDFGFQRKFNAPEL